MELRALVATLPQVDVAIGYGSGVFRQVGYRPEDAPMVDLVLGVNDAEAWHAENLRQNPGHYCALARAAGPLAVAWFQRHVGAGLWYNTLVPIAPGVPGAAPGQMMKYGVAEVSALESDLSGWTSLYVAGRAHKPLRLIQRGPDSFSRALRLNLESAAAAALLQLPDAFTARQLLVAVAGISYAGDFRMVFGENPRKVENIVDGQFDDLARLYWPVLADAFEGHVELPRGAPRPAAVIRQTTSTDARMALVARLPPWVGNGMARRAAEGTEARCLSSSPTVPRAAAAAASRSAAAVTRSPSSTSWWMRRSASMRRHDVTLSRAALGMVSIAARTAAAAARRRTRAPVRPEDAAGLELALSASGDSRADLIARLLRPTLASVVARASATQSLKGLVTAGPAKSVAYSAAKLRKWAKVVFGGTRAGGAASGMTALAVAAGTAAATTVVVCRTG